MVSERLARLRELVQAHVIDPLYLSNNPPWFDARGTAIGLFVALGIPIGGHTAMLCLLRLLMRFNFAVAFAVTWIVNPFTVIPIYYAYYYAGSVLMGDATVMGMDGFRHIMAPVLNAGHFLEALKLFFYLDFQILERWLVSAALVSTVSAVLGYLVTWFIKTRRTTR